MRRAFIIRGIVLTFVTQAAGARWADRCYGHTIEGQRWGGFAFHLTPWRKNQYGDRLMGQALCIGRVKR